MAEVESRVLWIGPVVRQETLAQWRALSPAANRWQQSFIAALRESGTHVEVLGHIPEPLWPRGALRIPSIAESLSCGAESHTVPYWNVPWARPWMLRHAYLQQAEPLLKSRRFDIVVTYNITVASHAVGVLARDHGLSWIAIIADTPVRRRDRDTHDRRAYDASGRVYLSWSAFQAGEPPKLHIDGGVQRVRRAWKPPGGNRRIVYAGSVSKYAGVKLLVDAFQHCDTNRELWICGRGDDPDVARAVERDSRITRRSFVTDDELEQISMQADVFVNPRGSIDNEGNFPSKVLEYLTYLRPVVSTWTPGMSPEFRDVLVCTEETPSALADAIESVLRWNTAERNAYAAAAEHFLVGTRSWALQTRRFRDWVSRDVARVSPSRHQAHSECTTALEFE